MSGATSVITCCITNCPKTQGPKAIVTELSQFQRIMNLGMTGWFRPRVSHSVTTMSLGFNQLNSQQTKICSEDVSQMCFQPHQPLFTIFDKISWSKSPTQRQTQWWLHYPMTKVGYHPMLCWSNHQPWDSIEDNSYKTGPTNEARVQEAEERDLWEGCGHCPDFLNAGTKCLTSATSGRKFALAHSLGVLWHRGNGEDVAAAVTAGAGGSCHPASAVRKQRDECWLWSFSSLHDLGPGDGESSFLGQISPETPSQTCPKVCLLSSVTLNPVKLRINPVKLSQETVQTAQEMKMLKKLLMVHIMFLKHLTN